jgi:leucyl aminopeptidase (aminopeptidase T)
MAYSTRSPAAATVLTALVVIATLFGSGLAAAADVSEIELRRLLDPTEAELAAEAEGRIYIYDGLTDRDIQRALNEEFERVENMMFVRTRKTDPDGALKRNKDTGAVEVEDDGC